MIASGTALGMLLFVVSTHILLRSLQRRRIRIVRKGCSKFDSSGA